MPIVTGFTDVDDLKYKIATHPGLVQRLASLAHILGYGWCGGTQAGLIGYGFDASYSNGSYILQAHYDKNDPHADGYWADNRLKMTLSNFRTIIIPTNVHWESPTVSELQPLFVSDYTAKNYDEEKEDKPSIEFAYELSTTRSHSTSYKFTESIKLGSEVTLGVPLFGEGKATVEFQFTAEQGWTDTEESTVNLRDTVGYEAKLSPKKQRTLTLWASRHQGTLDYVADAFFVFTVQFDGFLRWSWNARTDFPRDRPSYTATFGDEKHHAFEAIVDKYRHRDQPDYSEWDWARVAETFPKRLPWTMRFFEHDIMAAHIPGQFRGVQGYKVEVEAGPEEDIPEEDIPVPMRDALELEESDLQLGLIYDDFPGVRASGYQRLP